MSFLKNLGEDDGEDGPSRLGGARRTSLSKPPGIQRKPSGLGASRSMFGFNADDSGSESDDDVSSTPMYTGKSV